MKFVVVEWDDAWQDQENFQTAHGIALTHKPLRVATMGLLIKDDETGVSIVNEQTKDDDPEYRGRTFIPRAMVRSVTEFRLVKPRKKRENAEKSPEQPRDPS